MKKSTIWIAAILLICATTVNGQDEKKDEKKIGGIRAGWHIAALVEEGSKPDTAKNLNSFYVGFFRDSKIAPMLYFGSGLEYFQNGMSYSNNTSRHLHTLSIPLNLKLKLGPVYARGGIAANFKVSEKMKIAGEYINLRDVDKSAWFDAPVFVGAGVDLLFLTVEARYHWGLIEVKDGLHSQYFQIGAGIRF